MPEHMLRSTRARVFAAVMTVALTAVSYAIWTSPGVRRVAGEILTARLPTAAAAQQPRVAPKRMAQPVSPGRRTGTDRRAETAAETARLRARLAALQNRVGEQHATGNGDL